MNIFNDDQLDQEYRMYSNESSKMTRDIKPFWDPLYNSPENLALRKKRDLIDKKLEEIEQLRQERDRKRNEILEKHKYSLVDQAYPIESDEQFETIRAETDKIQRKLILLRREGKDSVTLQKQLTANRLAIAKHKKLFKDVFVLPNKINDIVTPDMVSDNVAKTTEEEQIEIREPKDYKALAKKESDDAMFGKVVLGGILLWGLFTILIKIRFPANKSFDGFEAFMDFFLGFSSPVLAFLTAYFFAWLNSKKNIPDIETRLRNLGEYNDTIEPYRGVTIQKLDENWWELELSDALMDRRKERKVRIGINFPRVDTIYELIDWAYARGWW